MRYKEILFNLPTGAAIPPVKDSPCILGYWVKYVKPNYTRLFCIVDKHFYSGALTNYWPGAVFVSVEPTHEYIDSTYFKIEPWMAERGIKETFTKYGYSRRCTFRDLSIGEVFAGTYFDEPTFQKIAPFELKISPFAGLMNTVVILGVSCPVCDGDDETHEATLFFMCPDRVVYTK